MPWTKSGLADALDEIQAHILPGRWGVTQGPQAHTIRDVLSLAKPDHLADGGRSRLLLTRRRVVDHCHIAAALCPGMFCLQSRS